MPPAASSILVVSLLTALASPALADQFTYTNIDDPLATLGTLAYGINNTGQIVGQYFDASGGHGFVDNGGIFTTIDDPLASGATAATGINNLGQIVGSYTDAGGVAHGFLDVGGTFTTVDDPLGSATFANGINDSGQIVGEYNNNGSHGFLDTGGTFTNVDDLSIEGVRSQIFVQGINDAGQISGYYTDLFFFGVQDLCEGFVVNGGTFTYINRPHITGEGNFETCVTGINDAGQLVGFPGGFVDNGGIFTNVSAGAATDPFGINDAGQIVGYYYDASGSPHGFLATPTTASPEPSTLAMAFAAVLAIAVFRMRMSVSKRV